MSGRPNLVEFTPYNAAKEDNQGNITHHRIDWQCNFIEDFYNRIQAGQSNETQIILLSGAVGSSKSLAMEHILCRFGLEYPGMKIGLGRLTMPSLKQTLLRNIIDHFPEECIAKHDQVKGYLKLVNGTEYFSYSWSDKKYKKVRSEEFTVFAIEEATETDVPHAYSEILMRIRQRYKNNKADFLAACQEGGRAKRPVKFLIMATNPDSPEHWVYEEIIANAGYVDGKPTGHGMDNISVYYSITSDNPFLDDEYREVLENQLSPKEAERMVFGKWVDISE